MYSAVGTGRYHDSQRYIPGYRIIYTIQSIRYCGKSIARAETYADPAELRVRIFLSSLRLKQHRITPILAQYVFIVKTTSVFTRSTRTAISNQRMAESTFDTIKTDLHNVESTIVQ